MEGAGGGAVTISMVEIFAAGMFFGLGLFFAKKIVDGADFLMLVLLHRVLFGRWEDPRK